MSYTNYLIQNFKNKGIVIDANIFLVLLIGSVDVALISGFKKTLKYTEKDFQILQDFLSFFLVFTTPNILTEVSNHCETLNNQKDGIIFLQMRNLLKQLYEEYIISTAIADNKVFWKFGLTDGSIYELAERGFLILTDDFPLYQYLLNESFFTINFNHLRSEYLLK